MDRLAIIQEQKKLETIVRFSISGKGKKFQGKKLVKQWLQ